MLHDVAARVALAVAGRDERAAHVRERDLAAVRVPGDRERDPLGHVRERVGLVLSHDPDVFPHVPERVALTVAGHTHGGQVALPYLRRPFVPSRHGERFVRGHVVEHGRHLVVGAGLGTSGLPVRLLAPPELLLLELLPG